MMSEQCERYRELIADSLSAELPSSDRTDLDEHLERCSDCREYLNALNRDDRLLRGYVSFLQRPISELEAATVESLRRDAGATSRGPIPYWRKITRLRYAAVIVIAAAAAWAAGHFSGAFRGSAPAFAAVLEEIARARNVSYRCTYRIEGAAPIETRCFVDSAGMERSESPAYGTVTLYDWSGGKQFVIDHAAKKATLMHRVGRPAGEGLGSYLDWVRTLHKRSAEYAGEETVDGQKAKLFVNNRDSYDVLRVWVDPGTDLPLKAQFVSNANPNSDIIRPSISLGKKSFGGKPDESQSITYSASGGITVPSTVTMDGFAWNADLDDSLFHMEVPAGYKLEVDTLDVSTNEERDLIDALSLWTRISGGTFPEDINDLGTDEKARPLLIAAFARGGAPEREFDEAMAAANVLCKGCLFAQEMKVDGSWRYGGRGVRIGDTDAPVCWWRSEDSEQFRIVYGDLRVEDIREDDLPGH